MTTRVETLLENAAWLRRLARTLVRDEHAAEDLVQETWRAGLTARASPRDWRAWLGGVVRRLARRAHRDRFARDRRETRAARSHPGSEPPASHWLEEAELQRELLAAALALDEPCRSVVLARFFEGASLEAIARREGVPGSTVRTRLQRALERLRARLDRRYGDRAAWGAIVMASWPAPPVAGSIAVAALVVAAAAIAVVFSTWPGSGTAREVEPSDRLLAAAPGAERLVVADRESHPARRESIASSGDTEHPAGALLTEPPVEEPAAWILRGRVADAAGRAVAEAEVLWCAEQGRYDSSRVQRTDASGGFRFTFEDREHAEQAKVIGVQHPRYVARYVPLRRPQHAFREGVASVDVVLERGCALDVLVTDEGGIPVPDARVRLGSGGGWGALFGGKRGADGTTDEQGLCALTDVPPGEIDLAVSKNGLLPHETRKLRVERGHATARAVLQRGSSLEGIVLDPDGAPVEGAQVTVYAGIAGRIETPGQLGISGPDGRFSVAGLPGTRWDVVRATHPDFVPLRFDRPAGEPDGGDVRLVLDPGRKIELFLVDAASGLPWEGLSHLEPEPDDWRLHGMVSARVPVQEGRLAIEHFTSAAGGFWLTCPGHDALWIGLDDASAGRGETLRLQPVRRWTVEVVDGSSGGAVAGAVVLVHVSAVAPHQRRQLVNSQLRRDGSGAAANEFRFDSAGLRPATLCSLRVSAPGYSERTVERTAEDLRAGPDTIRIELARL